MIGENYIVDDHNMVFDIWKDSGVRNGVLVHVDSHPDMLGQCSINNMTSSGLDIASFILPAFYAGIVNTILWINPQATDNKKIVYLGGKIKTDLGCNVKGGILDWTSQTTRDVDDIEQGEGREISFDDVHSIIKGNPVILDIDLDAFACQKTNTIYNRGKNAGITGWEDRVDFLRNLQGIKPDLYTIAESQGAGGFTPSSIIPDIQKRLQSIDL